MNKHGLKDFFKTFIIICLLRRIESNFFMMLVIELEVSQGLQCKGSHFVIQTTTCPLRPMGKIDNTKMVVLLCYCKSLHVAFPTLHGFHLGFFNTMSIIQHVEYELPEISIDT